MPPEQVNKSLRNPYKRSLVDLITNETIRVMLFHVEGPRGAGCGWRVYVPPASKKQLAPYFKRARYDRSEFTEPKEAVFKLIRDGKIETIVKLWSMQRSFNKSVFWLTVFELDNFQVFKELKKCGGV